MRLLYKNLTKHFSENDSEITELLVTNSQSVRNENMYRIPTNFIIMKYKLIYRGSFIDFILSEGPGCIIEISRFGFNDSTLKFKFNGRI